MRPLEGIASVLEEEMFERKLRKLSMLNPYSKRQRLRSINSGEAVRYQDHINTNLTIEEHKVFESEWKRENPDGEYQE